MVVDARLLRQAEEARGESGMETWLVCKGTPQKDKAVAGAVAALDGEADPEYDDTEPTSPVATEGEADGMKIQQGMSHHAFIDMGVVKKVAMWAVSTDADPSKAPEFVPKWARDLAFEGYWDRIDAMCNWVMGLSKGK